MTAAYKLLLQLHLQIQHLGNNCQITEVDKNVERHWKCHAATVSFGMGKRRYRHRLVTAWDVAAGNSSAWSQRPQCTLSVQDVSHRTGFSEKNKQAAPESLVGF